MASLSFETGNKTATGNLLVKRLERIVGTMPPAAIDKALAEDDVGTLLDVVIQGIWHDDELNGLDRARLRGIQYRRDLLTQAGGVLSVSDVAETLGITTQAVRKQIKKRQLIAMERQGGYAIPAIQIQGDRLVPGLNRVLKTLPIENAWMRLDWLMRPDPRLDGQSPLDALNSDTALQAIVDSASMVGEQGAA